MNSFYGGKQGFSFVIVKSFSSETEMITAFKRGPSYTDVHFDEYVLINTPDRRDETNGRVYRRGYDYAAVDGKGKATGGAIYIGTIAGPAGLAPMLELSTIQEVEDKTEELAAMGDQYEYRSAEGIYAPKDYEVKNSSGQVIKTYTENDVNLIPGKEKDGTFNDTIKWKTVSIRDIKGKNTTAYIGFEMPYPVIDFTSTPVDAYTKTSTSRTDDYKHPFFEKWDIKIPKGIKGDTLKNFRVITAAAGDGVQAYSGQDDDRANSRQILVYDYYNYDGSAAGVKTTIYLGDYNMIDNIILADDGTFTIQYSHDNDKVWSKKIKWITETTLDTNNGKLLVKYNTGTTYSTTLKWAKDIALAADGKITVTYTTGPEVLDKHLKWIKSMVMNVDGTVIVNYNDGTNDTFDKQIQWITDVSLTEEGVFTVKYNNGTPDYTTSITWIKDVVVEENGTVKIVHNNKETIIHDKMIKYITDLYVDTVGDVSNTSMTFDESITSLIDNQTIQINGGNVSVEDDGKTLVITDVDGDFEVNEIGDYRIHVVYNTGEVNIIGEPLKYVETIYIDPADNKLHVIYNNGDEDINGAVIKWIDKIYMANDKTIHVKYNTGEDITLSPAIKFVSQMYLDTDKTLHVLYNTGEDVKLSDPIKFIDNIIIGDDQKVHITYNTGEIVIIGDALNYIVETVITDNYHYLVYYSDPALRQQLIDAGKAIAYNGKNGWADLGSIKEENGILIGLNLSLDEPIYSTLEDIATAINYLNTTYPIGLQTFDLKGKIVTIGSNNDNKKFYAFDYSIENGNYKGWYYLGDFSDNRISVMVGASDDADIETKKQTLDVNGIWFIVEA